MYVVYKVPILVQKVGLDFHFLIMSDTANLASASRDLALATVISHSSEPEVVVLRRELAETRRAAAHRAYQLVLYRQHLERVRDELGYVTWNRNFYRRGFEEQGNLTQTYRGDLELMTRDRDFWRRLRGSNQTRLG